MQITTGSGAGATGCDTEWAASAAACLGGAGHLWGTAHRRTPLIYACLHLMSAALTATTIQSSEHPFSNPRVGVIVLCSAYFDVMNLKCLHLVICQALMLK
eukprot:scaffold204108_cov15-Tisochrysis_lutea.AAC.1